MSGGSSGKTVTTIYQDGPDDGLIVKDGYEGSKPYAGTKTGTSYDTLRGAAIDAVEQLKQHSKDLKTETAEVNENIALEKEEDPLDKNEGYKRMSGSDGSILGSLNNLSSAASSLFSLKPNQSSIVSNGGKVSSNLSVTDINSILNIINKLSNGNYNGTAKDVGATTALISKTTTLASNNGINNSYQALVKNNQLDRSIIVDAAAQSIKDTASEGNINVALDVSKAGLLSDVVLKEPTIINKILTTEILSTVSIEDKKVLFKSIYSSFNSTGISWNTTKVNGLEITDLKSRDISSYMKEMLFRDIGSTPLTVFSGNDNTKNAAIDKQLTDPSLVDVMSLVYSELSFEDKQLLVEAWNTTENKAAIETYKRKVDYYLCSQFPNRTVKEDLIRDYFLTDEILDNTVRR